MKKLLVVTFCLCSAGCWVVSGVIRVSGYERETVRIECSHGNAGTNLKYFCGNQCTYEDILVKTKNDHPNKTNGRFSLYDHGSGTFTVTITGLRKNDTGKYWCGIDRAGFDAYTEVHLTVIEAPTTTPTTPQTTPSTVPHSTAPPPGTTAYIQESDPTVTSVTLNYYPLDGYILASYEDSEDISYERSAGLHLCGSGCRSPGVWLDCGCNYQEAVSCGMQNPSMAPIGTAGREKKVDDYEETFQQPAADTAVNLHEGPNRITSESCKNNCSIYDNVTLSPLHDDLI